MKSFNGTVLFLDRSDINTDEIIPAKYLTEVTKEALKPHLLEDLNLPGFDPNQDLSGKSVIVTRSNFGCGSSREHAPWALEMNGINLIIAESFARIFRQNIYNNGMMAVELPQEKIEELLKKFADRKTECAVDTKARTFRFKGGGKSLEASYSISPFDEALITAGGWVEYADTNY